MKSTKICNGCGVEKPATDFCKRKMKGGSFGLRPRCNACVEIYRREKYQTDPAPFLATQQKRRRFLRDEPGSRAVVLGPKTSALFWSHVIVAEKDDCWEWLGTRDPKGYGRFLPGIGSAHRVAYELHHGIRLPYVAKITPTTPVVRHTCDNPPCCNPFHL